MTTPTIPLTPDERRAILAVIEEAARDIYPELGSPYLEAIRAVRDTRVPVNLEGGLPHEVIEAACREDFGIRKDVAIRSQLQSYLFGDEKRDAHALWWLKERIGPLIERSSRIDPESFRFLWNNLLGIDRPTQLISFLAMHFTDKERGGCGGSLVDEFLFVYQSHRLAFRTLCPSERWAVYQVLRLLAEAPSEALGGAPAEWVSTCSISERTISLHGF
jgi:hypothetical protein